MHIERTRESTAPVRRQWALLLVSWIFALCLISGWTLSKYGSVSEFLPRVVLASLLLGMLMFFVFRLLFSKLDVSSTSLQKHDGIPIWAPFASAAAMLLGWLPVLLAAYPGFFTYDAGLDNLGQWQQVTDGVLNAHHPVLHTMFLEYTIKFGESLFGSFNAGVCLSASIQACIVAAILSGMLGWLARNGIGRCGYIVATVYFAIDPVIAMFSICTTKDVLSSSFLVMFCLLTTNLLKEKRTSAFGLVFLGLSSFIVCILRSNLFIVIAVVCILVVMFVPKPNKLFGTATIATSIVLALVWLGPVGSAMKVESSPIGSWNALGTPMQQLARVATDENVVSPSDHEALSKLLPDLVYDDNLSDVARATFMTNGNYSMESDGSGIRVFIATYLDAYIEYGLKYPQIYLDAFLIQTAPAWSPFAVMDCYVFDGSYKASSFSCSVQEPATADSKIPWLYSFLEWLSSSPDATSAPFIGLLISIPFYMACMLLALVRAFINRNRAGMMFVAPLLLAACTNLFGPCMLIRYFLYLFIALPVFVLLILDKEFLSSRKTCSIDIANKFGLRERFRTRHKSFKQQSSHEDISENDDEFDSVDWEGLIR